MRKLLTHILIIAAIVNPLYAAAVPMVWQKVTTAVSDKPPVLVPDNYLTYSLNGAWLRNALAGTCEDPEQAIDFTIPAPDGSFKTFAVWSTPMMEGPLAAKYPEIRTFSGYLKDNHNVTIKIDLTSFGFHAMVYDGKHTYLIDPYSNTDDGFYICYYKKDYSGSATKSMICEIAAATDELGLDATYLTENSLPPMKLKVNGTLKRTFRLALACTGQYAVAVAGPSPTKAAVLSKMVISMNRVNGVFEKEVAVTMSFIANNDTLIFLNSSTDPFSNTSGDLSNLPTTINALVGLTNYDIGHLFGTGGGGVATLGCVCKSNKAQGLTGSSNPQGDAFDIDYVAHEMGHQFGADHTFNANTNSCANNGESTEAYEPGSGSTLMAYAGLCGSANNIQNKSDDYFHAISLSKITDFLTSPTGANCAVTSATGNTPPDVPAFSQNYVVPMLTPFELTAPAAIDVDHDELNYCWEQWNRGDFKQSFANVRVRGPIFRSFQPDTVRTRVFPEIDKVLQGVTSYIGEKLPDTTRYLTFKLTVRDMLNGIGSYNFPDDTIHLDVKYTAGPFKVLTPGGGANWMGGSTQTVTWDVANTDIAPVSCSLVDIYLSEGGGHFPHLLKAGTPNDGSETVVIPNVITTNQARIKVKAAGNVFFNVSPGNFTITHDPNNVAEIAWQNQIVVYPVPATDLLRVLIKNNMKLEVKVCNAVGQAMWTGTATKELEIPVRNWAKGFYYIQLLEPNSGARIVKPILVQ